MDETGARINIPPPSMMKNDISVAGDKDSVAKAVAQVKKIWGEMVRMLLLLSFECLVFSLHSPSPPSPLLFSSALLLSPSSLSLFFSLFPLAFPPLSLFSPLLLSLLSSLSIPPLLLLHLLLYGFSPFFLYTFSLFFLLYFSLFFTFLSLILLSSSLSFSLSFFPSFSSLLSLLSPSPSSFLLQKRTCSTVSVEVRKSQHKYIIGPRGQGLQEILQTTGWPNTSTIYTHFMCAFAFSETLLKQTLLGVNIDCRLP